MKDDLTIDEAVKIVAEAVSRYLRQSELPTQLPPEDWLERVQRKEYLRGYRDGLGAAQGELSRLSIMGTNGLKRPIPEPKEETEKVGGHDL